ncbi:BnaC03g16330D [Brassica napus]|uniref:BnaC03g16330D protein n=1 Tax=Brassica napus TaxID=3708 RepID=A0A078I4K5_BRANA|nr:BnaC03g16330D [Brassica napus]
MHVTWKNTISMFFIIKLLLFIRTFLVVNAIQYLLHRLLHYHLLSVSSFSLVKQQDRVQREASIVFIREWTIVLRLERSPEWSFVKGVCFDQVRECCSLVSVLYSPLCCCWRGHESCCCCLVVLMLL